MTEPVSYFLKAGTSFERTDYCGNYFVLRCRTLEQLFFGYDLYHRYGSASVTGGSASYPDPERIGIPGCLVERRCHCRNVTECRKAGTFGYYNEVCAGIHCQCTGTCNLSLYSEIFCKRHDDWFLKGVVFLHLTWRATCRMFKINEV